MVLKNERLNFAFLYQLKKRRHTQRIAGRDIFDPHVTASDRGTLRENLRVNLRVVRLHI